MIVVSDTPSTAFLSAFHFLARWYQLHPFLLMIGLMVCLFITFATLLAVMQISGIAFNIYTNEFLNAARTPYVRYAGYGCYTTEYSRGVAGNFRTAFTRADTSIV